MTWPTVTIVYQVVGDEDHYSMRDLSTAIDDGKYALVPVDSLGEKVWMHATYCSSLQALGQVTSEGRCGLCWDDGKWKRLVDLPEGGVDAS